MDKLSIIVPCFNEEEMIPVFFDEVQKNITKLTNVITEYWFINDGSSDKSLEKIKAIYLNNKDFVHYIDFSRNLSVLGGIAASVVVIKFSIYLDGFFKNRFGSWLKKVLVFFGANSLLMLCFHLIDLDSVNIWPRIVEISAAHLPYVVAIIIGIIYRIIFVLIATLIVSKTPVINSLYMNRKHPIKNIFKSIR